MQEIVKDLTEYRSVLREKLLDESMRAFMERGVKAVKMDEISNRLSVSKRTIYEIFGDKETLLFEGVRKYDMLRRKYMEKYAAEGHNVMDILLEAYKQSVEQQRHVSPQFYEDLHHYPLVNEYIASEHKNRRAQFLEFLRQGVREGYFSDQINYHLVLLLFEAAMESVKNNSLLKTYTMEELFTHFLLLPLRGLCTPEGQKVIAEYWK